ncbi:AAL043Cp [Eremothecium gossypii ATCC 10895]|uniref:AAL043Cp n=1 Tax=Eremothecium gossypii (strain ATCC 10895 / CBS 109.51 / FGSC 9923 / NRRL Y-1056) TaxID=284811 RepID=Q75EX1_EREGS|nr:AAL043Cp [Eremothecium gossypii ATCC 10895]AAS50323.2 AAL043Cp [Eremothecium gossypii ATCC 10895]AEY94609.1 FAAL043Cp [Eremothecium gossypii FDAG1]
MSAPIIGIAFGNTSSSIAYVNPKKDVDVIANPDGERAIPSCLSYVGDDEYHGGQALQQLVRNASNTIVNFRDFVGLSYAECDGNRCATGAPLVDLDGKPGFLIARAGREERLTVDEVVTRHLRKLREAAEDYIGQSISQAVLTVPTNFAEKQKSALRETASRAGLEVVQFVNEPSSALLAHVEQFPFDKDVNVVVADFGGVRSDAAVVAVRNGIFTLLATEHDATLGGALLDEELIEFFAKDFEAKNKCNPRKNARSLAKLRASAEITKKTLSNATSATISIDSLADGFDYHNSVNRMRYELVANKVFSKFTQSIQNVITKANLDVLDIDAVLLAGGVSFTPKLTTNLEFLFPESVQILGPQHKNATNNPNELLASGAALQAQLVSSYDADELAQALQPIVINTQHLSKNIGVLDAAGKFVPILLAESSYPIRKTVRVEDATGDILISVYEGTSIAKETVVEPSAKDEPEDEEESEWSDEDDEPEVIREKDYVIEAKLMDLGIKNVKGLELSFTINKDGVLTVAAKDLGSSNAVKGSL